MSAQHGPGLTGLRVVECGQGVSAAYATKMLADLGADVIKVEPPDGDVTRHRGPFPGDRPTPTRADCSSISTPTNAASRPTSQRPTARRSCIACWPMPTS